MPEAGSFWCPAAGAGYGSDTARPVITRGAWCGGERGRVVRTLMPEATDTRTCGHTSRDPGHYDLSDDFFGLFRIDPEVQLRITSPGRTSPCPGQVARRRPAPRPARSQAGDDPARGGLRLGPDATQRAMERYDVNVIGLTLSKNQKAYCDQLLSKVDSERTFDVRLEGWEQFHSPSTGSCRSRRSNTSGSNAATTLQELLRHPCPTTAG